MKIENIMTKKVYSLKPTSKMHDAIMLMKTKNIGCVPIVDEEMRIKGIITDRDIIVALAKGYNNDSKISEFMTKRVESLYPSDSLLDLTELMGYSQIRRVPVIDYDDRLVGIVSLGDLSLVTYSDNFASEALAEISYNPNKTDMSNYLYDL